MFALRVPAPDIRQGRSELRPQAAAYEHYIDDDDRTAIDHPISS